MKSIVQISKLSALVLSLALVATAATAEPQNSQAKKWYKIGLKERNARKRVAAFTKAVTYDSLYVEALYGLGLAYRDLNDFRNAERYLFKAYNARPFSIDNRLKSAILFDLATVYRRRGKLRDCEETLRGAKGVAVDEKLQGRIAFELGRTLYELGDYDQALAELHEGRQFSQENQKGFNNLISLAEHAAELQRLYEIADRAEGAGNLREARAQFDQIRAKDPKFKDVTGRIARLDSMLEAQTQAASLSALYDRAQSYELEDNLEMAIVTYENLLKQTDEYKDASAKLKELQQRLTQRQQQEELDAAYAAGMAALRGQDWTRAILSFEKVMELDRNYRDTRRRLRQAKWGLQRESTKTIVARYYANGIAAMNRNDLGEALAAFEKVYKLDKKYRNVAALLASVESTLEEKAQAAVAGTASLVRLDSLYQQALTFMADGDLMQSVVTFEKLQLLQPGYRDVVDRLAQARAYLNVREQASSESSRHASTAYYFGGAVAALIALPLLGFIVFSPSARARLHLFRGNYAAAAKIYERILERNPNRVKLYSRLANLYLLLGRNDELAMKAYKMILQLNLAARNREEINSIVAQHYLTEGRTDSDAIEVLETALQAERRKQGMDAKGTHS